VNTLLAIGCIFTTVQFRASDNLAAAYGIAVTGTMAITTMAYFLVARHRWGWPLGLVVPLAGPSFWWIWRFRRQRPQDCEGGWFPLAIGAIILAIMHTWKRGRDEIFARVIQ